jgi:hypothetical protein
VASLEVRSPLRSAHPLSFGYKAVSLTAFIVLLGAGWVALSYLKTDVLNRWQSAGPSAAAGAAGSVEKALPENSVTPPVRLVYSCADDRDYYHASTHLPSGCERTALSEETAISRGLKRCKTCFPD